MWVDSLARRIDRPLVLAASLAGLLDGREGTATKTGCSETASLQSAQWQTKHQVPNHGESSELKLTEIFITLWKWKNTEQHTKECRNYLHFCLTNTIVPEKKAASLTCNSGSEMGRGKWKQLPSLECARSTGLNTAFLVKWVLSVLMSELGVCVSSAS